MMYIHYCKECQYMHILNGHKSSCPKCNTLLNELNVSYLDYIEMNQQERAELLTYLADDTGLAKFSTFYRMSRYTKRQKEIMV